MHRPKHLVEPDHPMLRTPSSNRLLLQGATRDEHVAHKLFIELLAHQFAFPVQWINTQESLLTGSKAVKRLIELGPSTTLTGMAKKTIAGQIESDQRPRDEDVELLSSKNDVAEVCYYYEAHEEADESEEIDDTSLLERSVQQEDNAPAALEPVENAAAPKAEPVATISIEDIPITGYDVVRALVARKLKRPIAEISSSKSIKELCNGKSTLQNELVGDLHTEFGNLPDRPEDMSIKDLGEAVSTNASDLGLGMVSSTLLGKLVSTKMPPRFNVESMRKYLAEKWGIGPGRQTALLLYAITSEPENRLTSIQAAHHYLDGISSMYAAWSGFTLQAQKSEVVKTGVTAAVNTALSTEVEQAHKRLAWQQLRALSEYLQPGPQDNDEDSQSELLVHELQSKLDGWTKEFSEDFLMGVRPTFDPRKARRYNAYWRAARQELLEFYDSSSAIENGKTVFDCDPLHWQELIDRLKNKADGDLAMMAMTLARKVCLDKASSLGLAASSKQLAQAIVDAVDGAPKGHPRLALLQPHTTVSQGGNVQYSELPREEFQGVLAYVDLITSSTLHERPSISPFVSMKTPRGDRWVPDEESTKAMIKCFSEAVTSGLSFEGRRVLVTGAGKGSIGVEVVRLLLEGGARVIVTTSREPYAAAAFFQTMYEKYGGRGSELTTLQFNQASINDCDQLIDFIYDTQGLDLDLDAILPFAAASEGGSEVHDIGAENELVHRLMLTNVLRLLGRIIKNKRSRGIDCSPTQVLLPLSPNHGTLGGDGLYAESKLGLESLLNRVKSESWLDELSICGVKIGWTRSTGLMNANDIIAETIEKNGVLTFSVAEMALNIAALLVPEIRVACEDQPLVADFSGGLGELENCHTILARAREEINRKADIARGIEEENKREDLVRNGKQGVKQLPPVKRRSILQVGFPSLPNYNRDIKPLRRIEQGLPDPAEVVVVVGFSELGPLGSARLRWEMESRGRLSQTAMVEMAWLMGLVTHADELRKDGHYVGWVDAKTREPVADDEIEQKYGVYISEHCGIRPLEPEIVGYDPERKELVDEITVEEDLPPFETSSAMAQAFKLRHGAEVVIRETKGADRCHVQLKRGAVIMVPKASPFKWGDVAGQLPTGFDGTRYGVPEDLARQLDPVSVMALCCVAEAFYSAGVSDILEIFKYIHLSEIGNFIGSSMGGAQKTRHLYRDVFLGKEVDTDSLQDTYSNTTAAWVNMLLLGSAGPIKTPVGACATGVESIDSGVESIMAGKTKVCIVGGVDDLREDEAFGFSMLKATVNAEEERAKARLPSEMSRPTAESRSGFVEAHGCGVQILCRADLALEMGLPIYGIVAGSAMAADGMGKSVPAPGKGILSFAKEKWRERDLETGLKTSLNEVRLAPSPWSPAEASISSSDDSSSNACSTNSSSNTSQSSSRGFGSAMETPLTPRKDYELDDDTYDTPLRKGPVTSAGPKGSRMRESLRVWGLGIDDISFASLHGTSTKANDLNEPEVICAQMDYLGRTPGLPMWAICQKALTGHPKAPAAAWMLNGCLQALSSGVIPGNGNADNQDTAWREFGHLCLPTSSVEKRDSKAFLLTSFGFGQKGGQVIGIAPRYIFATQSAAAFAQYCERTTRRCRKADRAYAKALMRNQIVRVLETPPYEKSDAQRIVLDSRARICEDPASGSYRFDPDRIHGLENSQLEYNQRDEEQGELNGSGPLPAVHRARVGAQRRQASIGGGSARTIGVDVVRIESFDAHNNTQFADRNYTVSEKKLIAEHADERAAFAGRWAAKEAVCKCLASPSYGAGAAMKQIEILSEQGVPKVYLKGNALAAAQQAELDDISVSLSYDDGYVVAIALGLRSRCI